MVFYIFYICQYFMDPQAPSFLYISTSFAHQEVVTQIVQFKTDWMENV